LCPTGDRLPDVCPGWTASFDVYGDRRRRGVVRRRRRFVNYVILMYGSQRDYDALAGKPVERLGGASLSAEEFAPMYDFMESFGADLIESGELVGGHSLTAPVQTRRIQLQAGVPVVTDGPYAETQEVLSGFWVVDCESFDRASEIAARLARCPSPRGIFADGVIDVRPVAGSADGLDT
jgi:hypothetical protein